MAKRVELNLREAMILTMTIQLKVKRVEPELDLRVPKEASLILKRKERKVVNQEKVELRVKEEIAPYLQNQANMVKQPRARKVDLKAEGQNLQFQLKVAEKPLRAKRVQKELKVNK